MKRTYRSLRIIASLLVCVLIVAVSISASLSGGILAGSRNNNAGESRQDAGIPETSASGTVGNNASAPDTAGGKPASPDAVVPDPVLSGTNNPDIVSGSVSFSFAGDVMFDGKVEELVKKHGPEYVFYDVSKYFKASDVSMVNLETPVSKRGVPEKNKEFTFRADPEYLSLLPQAGITAVALANNHVLDYGRDALEDTFENLDMNGLLYAGAGKDEEEAVSPVYVEKRGIKIAIIASSRVIPSVSWYAGDNTSGVASTYDPRIIKEEISTASENADIVAVYVHWGKENATIPESYQRSLAHMYIDSGADIVVGSHPHVLQGIEFYKGGVIAYSLGNFVFGDSDRDTMLFNVIADNGKIAGVSVIPCRMEYHRPVVMEDEKQKTAFLNKLLKISFNSSIDSEGTAKPVENQAS